MQPTSPFCYGGKAGWFKVGSGYQRAAVIGAKLDPHQFIRRIPLAPHQMLDQLTGVKTQSFSVTSDCRA